MSNSDNFKFKIRPSLAACKNSKGAVQLIRDISKGVGSRDCHQITQGGGGLAKVLRDIFPKFLNNIFDFSLVFAKKSNLGKNLGVKSSTAYFRSIW
jgi:hypothetical protein